VFSANVIMKVSSMDWASSLSASVLQTLVQQVACEQYVQFYCLHHKLHMCQDFGVPKTQIEVVAGVTR